MLARAAEVQVEATGGGLEGVAEAQEAADLNAVGWHARKPREERCVEEQLAQRARGPSHRTLSEIYFHLPSSSTVRYHLTYHAIGHRKRVYGDGMSCVWSASRR